MSQESCEITFEITKEIASEQAVYVCGGLEQLGVWQPAYAFKLERIQRGKWRKKGTFQKVNQQEICFQFKFFIAQDKYQHVIEWENLTKNRRIDLSTDGSHTYYYAVWNHYNLLLCLHINHHPENDRYFVLGNQETLGNWHQKKQMQKLSYETSQKFKKTLIKYNPQLDQTFTHSYFYTYSLTLDSSKQQFTYFYIREGQTLQSQTYPGRNFNLFSQKEKKRLTVFDWQGHLVILDKSTFDQMMFERLTNSLFLSSNINNNWQFKTLHKKGVTYMIHLRTKREDYLMWNMYMKRIAESENIELRSWVFSNIFGMSLIEEMKQLINVILILLGNGHRICLHCSKKVKQSPTFELIILTLFKNYPYNRALSQIRKKTNMSEQRYIVAHDVLAIINGWLDRHDYHAKHK